MSRVVVAAILLCLVASCLLLGEATAADQRIDSLEMVILYAHTDYAVGVKGGRILSTAPPYGQRRSATLESGISFILFPPLSQELSIEGSVNYRLYLRSPAKGTANLNVSLYEVDSEGKNKRISSAVIALPVENQINQYVLGIPISHTFSKGSTILFSAIPKDEISLLMIFWDEERTDTSVALPIKRGFNIFDLQTLDSNKTPIAGANITVLAGESRIWTGRTDPMGWARALLPKSGESIYELIVRWKETVVNRTLLQATGDTKIQFNCKVYGLELHTRDLLSFPVDGATVTLLSNSAVAAEGKTSGDGKLQFAQLPESEYDIDVKYDFAILMLPLSISQRTKLQLASSQSREIELPILRPWIVNSVLVTALASVATASTVSLLRRRGKEIHEYDFSYFETIAGGGIPTSSSVMIVGPPGSGKTVLTNSLLISSLRNGNSCVFITNLDYPTNIRRYLTSFEANLEDYERSSKLIFIDCYSASGGQESSESYKVHSAGDLTGLGVQVSSCLEKLGQNTDVFLDSLTPLFTMLRDDYIANFVHSVGAKTKGVNGRFFYTLGTGIGKKGFNAIEAVSDCVIEVSSSEELGEPRRRLRIKKLKQDHLERWVDFKVDGEKGIIFRMMSSRAGRA